MTITEKVLQIKNTINKVDDAITCFDKAGVDLTNSSLMYDIKESLLAGLSTAEELERIETVEKKQ